MTERAVLVTTAGMDILDLPMATNDADAKTVGEYLKTLLSKVWAEGEKFNGKRPFGNSGWHDDVYAALVSGKAMDGKMDADGALEDCDEDAGDHLIQAAIADLFDAPAAAAELVAALRSARGLL